VAFDIETTIYDTLYHATAIIYEYEFVTLDKKYFDKAKKYGNIALVK